MIPYPYASAVSTSVRAARRAGRMAAAIPARGRQRGLSRTRAAFVVAIVGQTLAMSLLKRRLVRAEAHQRVTAERDALTGLFNRRSFDAALERTVASPHGGALALFDFDAFKAINDEHGHPVGDAVLRSIAAALPAGGAGG